MILHLPEVDLPVRFLPSSNSGETFIASTHSGTHDLKQRWIREKAVKEAGFPPPLVQECTVNLELMDDWPRLLVALGCKLIGESDSPLGDGVTDAFIVDEDEVLAMGAERTDTSQIVMTLFSAPIKLHIFMQQTSVVHLPGMYISSTQHPAYIRLHLLGTLLSAIRNNTFREPGEGFLVASMRILEDCWAKIEVQRGSEINHSELSNIIGSRTT